jgi:hypothetical protein
VIGREGKDSGVKSGREQLVYTMSLEKLWLSLDLELKWETEQEMPSSSNLEHNIFFSHPCLSVVDC